MVYGGLPSRRLKTGNAISWRREQVGQQFHQQSINTADPQEILLQDLKGKTFAFRLVLHRAPDAAVFMQK